MNMVQMIFFHFYLIFYLEKKFVLKYATHKLSKLTQTKYKKVPSLLYLSYFHSLNSIIMLK